MAALQQSRTEHSIKNLAAALSGQFLSLAAAFVCRIIFARKLGADYLGVNGLFSNLLAVLSLVELGIGPAIIYSLYKPLAERDWSQVQSLIALYRRVYLRIAAIVVVLGLVMTPWLEYMIKSPPPIQGLRWIFLVYVVNTAISYLWAWKRALLTADQRRRVVSLYTYGRQILQQLIQATVLLLSDSFFLFLLTQTFCVFLENVMIAKRANIAFPQLSDQEVNSIDHTVKKTIIKNTCALVAHKVGSIVVTGTDNILLSSIVGIATVGRYSNYQLVLQALKAITNQFFQSITASVGNLCVQESTERQLVVFNRIFLIGSLIATTMTISFLCLIQEFIQLAFGRNLSLEQPLVYILSLNCYLTLMRQSVLMFRDAMGLYWQDRYKPIFEAIINLSASIWLGRYWGALGIFAGTAISTVTTCLWIEPWVLFRYGLPSRLTNYFKQWAIYALSMAFETVLFIQIMSRFSAESWLSWILKSFVCFVCSAVVFLLIFSRTESCKWLIKTAFTGIRKKLF